MNNSFVYIIGALFIIMSISSTIAITQGNSSQKEICNMTVNSTLLNDTTPCSISTNISDPNNKPELIESMNNNKGATSTNLSASRSEQSNEIPFTVGSGTMSNESAYNLDMPTSPAKNASNLWYVIQAKPHGYT
jgi:hypothetical protein